MHSTTMSVLFIILCSGLLIDAQYTESVLHRITRQASDMNRKGPGMDQGMSAMKNMSENGMGHGRDMASKAHEMGKKIHDKIKDMKGYFNRSRRAVPSFIEIQSVNARSQVELHRMTRQLPGFDQAASAINKVAEGFMNAGKEIFAKAPEMAEKFYKQVQEMAGKFMTPSSRRRRDASSSMKKAYGNEKAPCFSKATTGKI
ncbi:uncharacterized protein LOC103569329 [Microplitis demolitor]|uniref:uncharacterized protein LOC103569329 n=1 Tax=Microplitis demolitor TaxID=69319 RepID=UPI0004CD20DB|nr:uncharacterized protein LOC103569329 [Microplitis demolitor]